MSPLALPPPHSTGEHIADNPVAGAEKKAVELCT